MPPGLPLKTNGPLMLMTRELVRGGNLVVVDNKVSDGASVVVISSTMLLPPLLGRLVVATKMGDCLKKSSGTASSLCGVRPETKEEAGNLM